MQHRANWIQCPYQNDFDFNPRIDSQSLPMAIQLVLVASSRLPVDSVLLEVGVHGAAYRRIEVGSTEAIE